MMKSHSQQNGGQKGEGTGCTGGVRVGEKGIGKVVGGPGSVIVKLNGVPIVPAAVSGLLLMTGATPAATTVIVSVALPVPFAFVAPSNTDVVPTVVGVPVIAPVAALTTTPAGSGPAV